MLVFNDEANRRKPQVEEVMINPRIVDSCEIMEGFDEVTRLPPRPKPCPALPRYLLLEPRR